MDKSLNQMDDLLKSELGCKCKAETEQSGCK